MILSCSTPSILCKNTSQTTDFVKSADAASENLGGAQDSSFLFVKKNLLCFSITIQQPYTPYPMQSPQSCP